MGDARAYPMRRSQTRVPYRGLPNRRHTAVHRDRPVLVFARWILTSPTITCSMAPLVSDQGFLVHAGGSRTRLPSPAVRTLDAVTMSRLQRVFPVNGAVGSPARSELTRARGKPCRRHTRPADLVGSIVRCPVANLPMDGFQRAREARLTGGGPNTPPRHDPVEDDLAARLRARQGRCCPHCVGGNRMLDWVEDQPGAAKHSWLTHG